jgi:hypothetical protein
MTLLLPGDFTDRILELLRHNGEIALTVEAIPTHETYQFKGRYLRHRDARPDDAEVVDRIRQRLVKSMKTSPYAPPEEAVAAFVSTPTLAVEFEVREVYLQTPGPGAGTRLAPQPEQ